MNESIPIVLSDKLAKLNPKFFWLGGGHTDVKVRVSLEEFREKSEYDVIMGDISDERDRAN